MHPDTVKVLCTVRDYALEGRLVRNPSFLFEDRDGNGCEQDDAERGCIIGLTMLAARDLGLGSSAENDALDAMGEHLTTGLFTAELSQYGGDGVLELIESTLGVNA